MYKVKVDGNTIYNPASSDLVIVDPKLTLEVNNAGEFEFFMPPTHPLYGSVERLSSVVTVEEDGSTIFEGRVTEEKTDFWKRKSYHCEGCLAYLKDTKQPPAEYHNLTVRQYLGILLNIHNSKVTADKQFELGAVTVTDSNDSLYRYTNWESTLQCINDDLIKSLGGYLRIRYEGGKRYLDYLAAFPNSNSQIIRFGRNLLDYASSYDSSDYCTVLIPQGAELEESPIPALHQRLSIEDVNGGSPYLVNADAVAEHGWIEKVIEWDGVHVATTLLRKGKKYLEDVQFDSMVLSIKAIDLHKLNPEIESIKLMDEIRAISKPHGMDRIFPVTKVSIPLDSASGTEYTLGTKVTHSLTSTTEAANEDILNRIKRAKTPQQILESAQDNASELIKSALNGYVVITDDASELLVMDTPDINTARKVWRWNVNGLGYSNNGYDGQYGLALTMDGAIVADFITTGTLNADLIRAGTMSADRIQGGTYKVGGVPGQEFGYLYVYDVNGNVAGYINQTGITMKNAYFDNLMVDSEGGKAYISLQVRGSGTAEDPYTAYIVAYDDSGDEIQNIPVNIPALATTDFSATQMSSPWVIAGTQFEAHGLFQVFNYNEDLIIELQDRSDAEHGTTVYINDAEVSRMTFKPFGAEEENKWYRPVASYGTNGNRVKYISAHSSSHSVPNSLGVNAQYGSTSAYSTKNFAPSSSDIRLKENVKDCEIEALPFIQKIRMRQFDWKQNGVHQDCGFIADELEQLDRNLSIGGGYEEDGTMNEKSVNDFYLLGYMVKAMQEMQAEIDYLKGVVTNGVNRRVDSED